MNFDVQTIIKFEKESRKLKRKSPSLKAEINKLIDELEVNPKNGQAIGKGFYKIRLAIKSKGKGKRGGARVITYVKIVATTVYLVSIFDKSEQSTISEEELAALLDEHFNE